MTAQERLYSTLQGIDDQVSARTGENAVLHRDGKLTDAGKLTAASILNFAQGAGLTPALTPLDHVGLLNLIVENRLHGEPDGV